MSKKIFFLCLALTVGQFIFCQKTNTDTDTLYWYKVKIDFVRDSLDFRPYLEIKQIFPEIYDGGQEEFLMHQKAAMQDGFLCIGPFKSKKWTEYSMIHFERANQTELKVEDSNQSLFWYLVKLNKTKKFWGYEYERTAAAIASGNINEFYQVLDESLSYLSLVIGPFPNQPEAEYSKFLNRILEPKRKSENKYVDYQTFYWFSIRLNYDSLIAKGTYLPDSVLGPVKYGTMNKYSVFKKSKLADQQIAIGPYLDYYDAIASLHFYNFGLGDLDFKPWDDEIFYYFIRLKEFSKDYIFYTEPCEIKQAVDYTDLVFQSVNSKDCMIIGPFRTQVEAEISMRLNTDKKYAKRNPYRK